MKNNDKSETPVILRQKSEELQKLKVATAIDKLSNIPSIGIQFSDLFNLDDIQQMQDLFSNTIGVASIITHPDGTPITNISNSSRLCSDIIRNTEKGLANCYKSDASLGSYHLSEPIVSPCLSGGLWDSGVSITVGGKHIANWLIGQIRNETVDIEHLLKYADEIGANREDFMEALEEVPIMSVEQFENVSKMLFAYANELSEKTYNNLLLKMEMAELEKATAKLIENDEKFRLISENTNDTIAIFDLNLNLTYISPSVQKFLGYTQDEALQLRIDQILSPNSLQKVYEIFEQVLPNELSGTAKNINYPPIELEEFHKNGSRVWAEISFSFLKDDGNKPTGIVLISRNITDRKQTEGELTHSLSMLNASLESTADGILVVDKAGKISRYNQKFADTWQIPKELMDMNDDGVLLHYIITQIIDPDEFITQVEALYQYPEKSSFDQFTLIDGRIFERYSQPQRIAEEIVGRVWSFRDVTNRKQAEEEIKLKNEQLIKANAEKNKFFSILAHDLRGPFGSFLGLTQIMANELPSLTMAEIQKIATSMENSATNLYRLLENLLQWSQIKQGLIYFGPEVVQLRPIVIESIELILEIAKNKNIEIANLINDNMHVFADNHILQSIIRNLVSNAVKFTNKGGKITLSAKAIGNKSVEISIGDTGIGMSPEIVENLFRIDVQTNRKGTEDELSTGLGLLLCKDFIEKHDGTIWIESEEGKGSTFYFTLPISN